MRDIPSIRAQNLRASRLVAIQGARYADYPFAIISAERGDVGVLDNLARTEELAGVLRASPYPFKRVRGVYRGTGEASFVVVLSQHVGDDLDWLRARAREFQQESILFVDGGKAFLEFLADGSSEELGTWQQATPEYAMAQDDYTTDGERFYVVRTPHHDWEEGTA